MPSNQINYDWGTEWFDESGQPHRLDGPAVEWADGTREWWVEGRRHRLDGPAVEWADGTTEFWRDDVKVTIWDVGKWRFLDTEEEMTTRPN